MNHKALLPNGNKTDFNHGRSNSRLLTKKKMTPIIIENVIISKRSAKNFLALKCVLSIKNMLKLIGKD